jgi:hypothetical protein
MHFPIFEMPWLGDRWLIGLVAILHVVINHAAAIGGSLVVVLLERKGYLENDERYEDFAYKLAYWLFIVTTTAGAMSGVGIWFTTMVSEPTAIGSLLRIFFAGWFLEWLVFIAEIMLIMAYFLSWHHFRDKRNHLKIGYAYVAMSVATMAIVTGILGAMLTPGRWLSSHSFWNAFFNATYGPQLVLRCGLALGLAAGLALFLSRWLAPKDFRGELSRHLSRYFIVAMPLAAIGGAWYLAVLPASISSEIPTALMTSRFASYVQASYLINGSICLALFGFGFWGVKRAKSWPTAALLLPFLALVMLLGQFERVREFVRKPYIIPGYMYANGIRVNEGPALDRDGILTHAPYTAVHRITPANRLIAGHEIYKMECASCHTLSGENALNGRTSGQNPMGLSSMIQYQHQLHAFMPPFFGTAAERDALAAYLSSLPR